MYVFIFFFFFKQKTAYEMRISDWSSDVCSSDLFAAIKDSFIAVFPPPPVMGLGTVGGFKLQIEDRGAVGYAQLDAAAQAFMAAARKAPELGPAFSSFQINVPQLDVDMDRVKAKQLGVPVTDVLDTMKIYLGSLYLKTGRASGRERGG